jgi:hypothetical protein
MRESDLSGRVANLSPAKLELLLRRLAEKESADGATRPAIPRRRRDADAYPPASFSQERLWFINQLEPDSPIYNVPLAVRLSGVLDVAALERALGEVVRRHESLRTTFREEAGKPVQVVASHAPLSVPLVDLSELPEAEREAQRLAAADARRPFDLSQGPLMRAGVLRLSADEHIALLAMHHIISDAWSMGLLVQEIAALYEAVARGLPTTLPELPIQFADYASWQREYLQGERLDAQLDYWTKQLRDAPTNIAWPADQTRPAAQTNRGARRFVKLSKVLTASLKELGRREGATLFMTLLAAFEILLHSYTGERDILIGSPIANRTRPETETLIGFFVNTLVLRADLSGDPTFRQLVRRVRETTLSADAHQDLPFDKLVKALQPDRVLSRMPLIQVAFTLRNNPLPALALPSLALRPLEVERGTVQFDLTLNLVEHEGSLVGSFEYKTDIFDAATAQRLWGHYEKILQSVVASSELRLGEIVEVLAEADRREWDESKKELEEARLQKVKQIKRKAVSGVQSKG